MNADQQPTDSKIIDTTQSPDTPEKLWQPLTRLQRRVAGVLIEKSKTTPDIYPMTINAIKTGSNQKSNRSPQLDLREDQVENTLYELRHLGAVIEVHSGGRVPKYKHQLYQWLGVERVELAVMGELLLRGEQTVGELRSRASRMDKIDGMSELKPIIANLLAKDLMVELTPPGRGQVVTHNLYPPEELDQLRSQFSGDRVAAASASPNQPRRESATNSAHEREKIELMSAEIAELKQAVAQLQQQVTKIQDLLN